LKQPLPFIDTENGSINSNGSFVVTISFAIAFNFGVSTFTEALKSNLPFVIVAFDKCKI
jgi:hypothetical protein